MYTTDPLIIVEREPLNAEATLAALGQDEQPTSHFYIRSNFRIPEIDAGAWRLHIGGAVERPYATSMDDLLSTSSQEVTITMECAGNGRTRMRRVASGTPWGLGAVGTASFRGVRLCDLLARAGVHDKAVEVVFRGTDHGPLSGHADVAFERSLPIAEAMREDVIVAYEMNGEALDAAHGFPARLIVPGYYGVASVKWLRAIDVVDKKFEGHFQTERYVYRDDPDMPQDHPVSYMRVRALLTSPADGEALAAGICDVSGIAWSGSGSIASVMLSDDDGISWMTAELAGENRTGLRVKWKLEYNLQRDVELLVRACDSAGNEQPLEPVENSLGYGNNVVQRVRLRVERN